MKCFKITASLRGGVAFFSGHKKSGGDRFAFSALVSAANPLELLTRPLNLSTWIAAATIGMEGNDAVARIEGDRPCGMELQDAFYRDAQLCGLVSVSVEDAKEFARREVNHAAGALDRLAECVEEEELVHCEALRPKAETWLGYPILLVFERRELSGSGMHVFTRGVVYFIPDVTAHGFLQLAGYRRCPDEDPAPYLSSALSNARAALKRIGNT